MKVGGFFFACFGWLYQWAWYRIFLCPLTRLQRYNVSVSRFSQNFVSILYIRCNAWTVLGISLSLHRRFIDEFLSLNYCVSKRPIREDRPLLLFTYYVSFLYYFLYSFLAPLSVRMMFRPFCGVSSLRPSIEKMAAPSSLTNTSLIDDVSLKPYILLKLLQGDVVL